jgi:hypothetical protein
MKNTIRLFCGLPLSTALSGFPTEKFPRRPLHHWYVLCIANSCFMLTSCRVMSSDLDIMEWRGES